MNQKQIGTIILILGIIIGGLIYFQKQQEDVILKQLMLELDSCFLDDGTCLHADRNYTPYVLGGGVCFALIVLGLYLIFIDKTQITLAHNQEKIADALKETKNDEKFMAFLAGFSEDERKIIEAIREQDGIKQSTLRFRTGLSKSTLSLLLKSLQERKFITRKPSGKTNEVYLIKKF